MRQALLCLGPTTSEQKGKHIHVAWLRPTRRPARGRSGARACPLPRRPHPAGRACSAQDGGPGRLLWQRTKRAGGASGRRGREGRPAGRAGARAAPSSEPGVTGRASESPCHRSAAPAPHAARRVRRARARTSVASEGSAPCSHVTCCAECPARQMAGAGQMPEAGDARGRRGRGGCAEVRA